MHESLPMRVYTQWDAQVINVYITAIEAAAGNADNRNADTVHNDLTLDFSGESVLNSFNSIQGR